MPEHRDRTRLRTTFDTVAELYDRARPTYPEPVFDDLVALGNLPPGGRIVEIGPGTGKATLSLAQRGFRIVGVELGASLAAFARRNLAGFPNAEIVEGDVETWQPDEAEFDAVVAFTAFHWLDPEHRYATSARLLREGGALAVTRAEHVLPANGDPFWAEVQEDYDAVVPHPDNRPPPAPDEVGDLAAELEASGLFRVAGVRRHAWDVVYTADEYVAVISTYSSNLALPEAKRSELYARIRRRIEARGTVRKSYLAVLTVGRRL